MEKYYITNHNLDTIIRVLLGISNDEIVIDITAEVNGHSQLKSTYISNLTPDVIGTLLFKRIEKAQMSVSITVKSPNKVFTETLEFCPINSDYATLHSVNIMINNYCILGGKIEGYVNDDHDHDVHRHFNEYLV